MARPALLLLVFCLLGACAERWTRPGATEAQADAQNAACGDQAALAVPELLVWQMVEPSGFDTDRRCYRRHGREVCQTFTRYRPARFGWVDVNRSPREGWRRECMRAQGFTFEGYRPLRLE